MSDDIATRLQAMYNSGQISSFIISKIPEGELSTGWAEQGLLAKGVSGNLQDKKNQEDLLIPIDRFSRLVRDYGTKIRYGLFIVGEPGTHTPKFVGINKNLNLQESDADAIGITTDKAQVIDLLRLTLPLVLQVTKSKTIKDPNLDYIEELIGMTANGTINHLISLNIPNKKQNLNTWLKKIIRTDLDSTSVVAKYGHPKQYASSLLLLSRWLFGLDILRRTTDAIATIIFARSDSFELFLWDSSQKILTYSSILGDDIVHLIEMIVRPLWIASDDLIVESKSGPKVIVGKKSEHHEGPPIAKHTSHDIQSLSVLRTRSVEFRNRLSTLIHNSQILKKRILKITKSTRETSMSEKSKDLLEELPYNVSCFNRFRK